MQPFDLLKLIFTNLSRARFRAALSASGVLIGGASIVVLVSVASGMQGFTTSNLSSIGPLNEVSVNRRGGFGGPNQFIVGLNADDIKTLTPDYLDGVAELPGVAAVTPRPRLNSVSVRQRQYQSGAALYGLDPAAVTNFDLPFQSGELDLGRGKVIVGSAVGESFTDPRRARDNLVDPIDLQDQTLTLLLTRTTDSGSQATRRVQVRVAGVLAPRGNSYDNNVFIQLGAFEELNAWVTGQRANRRQDGYSEAVVLAEEPGDVEGITTALQADGFSAFSSQVIVQRLNSTFAVLQVFVGAVGLIALAIAGTGIANTLITAIYERTREIGLMKAVGATDDQVLAVFLAEAGAIGGLGGLGGMLIGWGISLAANALVQQFYLPQVAAESGAAAANVSANLIAAPLWLLVATPLFATVMGVLAGWYPARRAAALDPVEALRAE